MKTSNVKASKCTSNLEEFKANNTFAEIKGSFYVIYSYGYHWPLYAFDKVKGQWYDNTEKVSPTTSKHHTQVCPCNHPAFKDAIEVDLKKIKDVIGG